MHLADACGWLATAEAKLGRTTEAERHHLAAFRAVDEAGLAEQSHRALSLAQFYRVQRDWAKHKATLAAWAAALLAASLRLRAAAAAPQQPPRSAEAMAEDADVSPPAPPPAPASAKPGSLFAGAACSLECEYDLLCAAVCMLHERGNGYITRGKSAKAALLFTGPLLACAARLDAFPTRQRGIMTPAQPLPTIPCFMVAEQAASMWGTQPGAGPGSTHPAQLSLLHLRIGLLAGAMGYDGACLPDRSLFPASEPPGLDERLLALNDAWKAAPPGGGQQQQQQYAIWLPPAVAKSAAATADALIGAGGRWRPCPDAVKTALSFLGKTEPGEAQQQAGQLALALLPFANALMGPDKQKSLHAARAAAAGAQLCGAAGMVANQAEALHLMGAALFHAGPEHFITARGVFGASLAAKRACGADGSPGLAAMAKGADVVASGTASGVATKVPLATTQAEFAASAGFVETLLFLAKLQWETREVAAAEASHAAAFAFSRARLGDGHAVTHKALATLMDCKKKLAAIASGAAALPPPAANA